MVSAHRVSFEHSALCEHCQLQDFVSVSDWIYVCIFLNFESFLVLIADMTSGTDP